MDEQQQSTQSQNGSSVGKYMIPVVVVVVIAAAVFAFYTAQGGKQVSAPTQTAQEAKATQTPEEVVTQKASVYKDGKYTVTGNYVSPGGPREIGVTITLKGDVITESVFEGRADDPTSQRFQGEFRDNYQPQVIGKNIDEVNLTKVAGSSLTPKGFDDALEKVKSEAKSS